LHKEGDHLSTLRSDSLGWDVDAAIAVGRSGAAWTAPPSPRGHDAGVEDSHPFKVTDEARYVPTAELGSGGMGRVVSATDRRLRRQIAFKQVALEVRDRPGMEQRLAREAWITAALDHPAIVPIFDAGQGPDGSLYYTMRLVRGRALTAAIREAEELSSRLLLLRHFLSACEAVAYAHSQGVIHRDIKPDNILVGEFGETQVADWGLARRVDEPDSATAESLHGQSHATASGAIVGTPTYMSPEQAAGQVADARSDVFGLGVVLYEIIAGVPPLHGKDTLETLSALRKGALPPITTKQPDAPPELATIVGKAMQFDPKQRYADARALASDISHYLDGRRVLSHRYSVGQEIRRLLQMWRGPLLVAGVSAVLLLLFGVWAIRQTRIERDAAVVAEQRTRRALTEADVYLARALVEQALDAQSVDAQPEAEVLASHALTHAESPEARGVLANFAHAARPSLVEQVELPLCQILRPRRDGAILCVNHGNLSVWSGRPLRKQWQHNLPVQDAAWIDEGRQIVIDTEDSLADYFRAEDGHPMGRAPGRLLGSRGFSGVSVGDTVLLHHVDGLAILSGKARHLHQVTPCGSRGSHLASTVSEQGDRIATVCTDGTLVVLRNDGNPVARIATGLSGERAGGSAVALAPDGQHAVVAALDGDVLVADLLTGAARTHRQLQGGVIQQMSFSPDSRLLLLIGDRGGPILWQPDSGLIVRRFPAQSDRSVLWSADSRELWIVGKQLRRWALPDTLSPLHLTAPQLPGLASAALSPTGDRLALARGDGNLDVLEVATARLLLHDRFQQGVLKGVSFLRDGSGLVAWAAGSPSLRHYDANGRVLGTYDFSRLRRAALLPSGWLVALYYGQGARLYRLNSPMTPYQVIGNREFYDMDQSGDGKTVALVDAEGAAWIIQDHPERPIGRVVLHEDGITSVAISHSGAQLAIANASRVQLFDVASQRPVRQFASSGRNILDIKLSADGRWLAAGDLDQTARVWAVDTGRLAAVLHGHAGRVSAVSFSQHGDLLVTASWDGSARLWGLDALQRSAAETLKIVESAWGLDLGSVHSRHAVVADQ